MNDGSKRPFRVYWAIGQRAGNILVAAESAGQAKLFIMVECYYFGIQLEVLDVREVQ